MSMPLVANIDDPQYINQYGTDVLALQVIIGGVDADPDGESITVTMTNQDTLVVAFTQTATRTAVGQYQIQLTPTQSGVPGNYTIAWSYTINGTPVVYDTYITIGPYSATYDALVPAMQQIINSVWMRFADLFDSPAGGPNLQTYYQTRFNRGRLADLLRVACGRLNTAAQPFMTYTIDGDGGATFPVQMWGPLLEQALFVEAVKHLRRSYLEQPDLMGGEVTRLDRQQYFNRWGEILQEEQANLTQQLDVFKIRNMTLGQPRVLVSSGIYGRYGPTRYSAGMAAARGSFLWAARF
jgi:hypothetical protein